MVRRSLLRRVVEWIRGYHRDVPRGVCRGEWSGVHCRDLPEEGKIARYPSQEVEQDRGHYCGLSGSDGAARNLSQEVKQCRGRYYGLPGSDEAMWNLLQEVEQSRDCCCGLPGGPGLSAEVRLECLAERGG